MSMNSTTDAYDDHYSSRLLSRASPPTTCTTSITTILPSLYHDFLCHQERAFPGVFGLPRGFPSRVWLRPRQTASGLACLSCYHLQMYSTASLCGGVSEEVK